MKKKVIKSVIPALVKIIGVLNWIAGILLILFGIMAIIFVNSGFYEDYAGLVLGRLGGLFPSTLYFVMILFIALGVFSILIGRGLWHGKNWARISQVVLALIWALIAISGMSARPLWNTFSLIINLLIVYYLLFNLQVKAAFLK